LEVFEEENDDFRKVLGLLGYSSEINLKDSIVVAPSEISLENLYEILILYENLIVVLNVSQLDLDPAKSEWENQGTNEQD
jgi:hypothetical protein